MKKNKIHNYLCQRNYYYDSHDKNGNFNGLTTEKWKEQIRNEWNCEKLKATLVVLIFHDANNLHVHAVVNFINSVSRTNALFLSKCSKIEDCIQLTSKKQLAQAYKYLLHIDQRSLTLKKIIYGQNQLEIFKRNDKKFDYHKMIEHDKEETEDQGEKNLLDKVINDIMNNVYGSALAKDHAYKTACYYYDELKIYNKILSNNETRNLLLSKRNEKEILQAIKLKQKLEKFEEFKEFEESLRN